MNKLIKMLTIVFFVIAAIGFNAENAYAKDSDGDYVIVIDPGHGLQDPGAKGTTGVNEKDLNLSIARAMKAELETYAGVKVYLTRSEDEWITNTGRAMIAGNLHADFLISLHNNSGSETNTGAIVYRSLNELYAESTNDMGSLILENLSLLGFVNGGVQTRTSTQYSYEDYYTLIAEGIRVGVPSIIIEHCFISNPTDAAMVSDANGNVNEDMTGKMGAADASAVATYFSLEKRTAKADSTSTVALERGYGLKVMVPDYEGTDVTWYSLDKTIASVDEEGNVVAKSEGTTNIVYKLSDETTGFCTVEVKKPEEIALTGAIDPTFYGTDVDFSTINVSDAFGVVVLSDGSSKNVRLDSIGTVDLEVVGIQDIDITYGSLKGKLRVVNANSSYVPEVTEPESTSQAPTVEETTTATETATDETAKADAPKDELIIDIVKYIIVVLAIIVIGVGLYVFEMKKKSKRRRR